MSSNKKVPIKPVGIIPGLNKVPSIHVNDEPIVTPTVTLSDLKRKPRRSMLGRRRPSLLASQADDKLISVCPQPSTSSSSTMFDTAKPRWSTLVRKAPVVATAVPKLPVNNPRLTQPSSPSGNIFHVPKPRRSMLGRKNLTGNTYKSEVSSFLKPVGTSSPKFNMCSSTPVTGHENPFEDQDLDSSAFFNGASDFSTWSIFKNSDQYYNYPVEKNKTRPRPTIFRPLVFDTKPEPSQKEVKSETSLGVEPLSPSIESEVRGCSFQYMTNEENCKEESDTEANLDVNKTEPEQKSENTFQDEENTVVENFPKEELKRSSGKKKFSVIKEEDDEGVTAIFAPAINEKPPVTPPSNIKDLLNKWNTLYRQWKNTCEEMESVGMEITERLQSIELESKNANDSSTDEANKENAPLRQLRKSMFNNYKTQFAFIQTPKNVKDSKPSTSACYTPNTFSARVTSAMKDIYN